MDFLLFTIRFRAAAQLFIHIPTFRRSSLIGPSLITGVDVSRRSKSFFKNMSKTDEAPWCYKFDGWISEENDKIPNCRGKKTRSSFSSPSPPSSLSFFFFYFSFSYFSFSFLSLDSLSVLPAISLLDKNLFTPLCFFCRQQPAASWLE